MATGFYSFARYRDVDKRAGRPRDACQRRLDVRPDGSGVGDGGGTCTLNGDPSRLHRLLENLFRNSAEHADEPAVTVGPSGFAVEDDGPGIPPEGREELLDWGTTDDPTGTGMALAIVAQVAGAHGWAVTVGESDAALTGCSSV